MTTVDQIVAEALRRADIGFPPHFRARPGGDASISPSAQTAKAWEPAGITLGPEQARARRARSIAIALALGAFVLVTFAVTIVRLGSGALTGPDYMRPMQSTK
jgi:hypothetical protein